MSSTSSLFEDAHAVYNATVNLGRKHRSKHPVLYYILISIAALFLFSVFFRSPSSSASYDVDSLEHTFTGDGTFRFSTNSKDTTSLVASISRYTSYKPTQCSISTLQHLKYSTLQGHKIYLAVNLYNAINILPTHIQEITAIATVIGPQNLFVSVYENGSTDNTPKLLHIFAQILSNIGVPHHIVAEGQSHVTDRSHGNTHNAGHRVPALVGARKIVMEPLLKNSTTFDTVLFINDIAFCATDLLEIVYQKKIQGADMMCGMDYQFSPFWPFWPMFYDTWVGRDISGRYFARGPWWGLNVIRHHPPSQQRYSQNLPFQVFSCWHGAAAISASAFLPPKSLAFRSINNSDIASECYLFAVDLWKAGMGKIGVAPRAKIAYEVSVYERVKSRNDGAVDPRMQAEQDRQERIQWQKNPPKLVEWRDWNYAGAKNEQRKAWDDAF